MRVGVRLGVDVGKARVGVARCDPGGMLATPLETVVRSTSAGSSEGADISRIGELSREYGAIEIVVGLPLGLSGHRTPSTEDAEGFARRLASALPELTVRLVDERLSTVSAQGQLHAAGKRTKQSRSVIDQAAAVVILQHALDVERARAEAPGIVVDAAERLIDDRNDGSAGE